MKRLLVYLFTVALMMGATTVYGDSYPAELAGDEFVGALDAVMVLNNETDYSALPIGIGGNPAGTTWHFIELRDSGLVEIDRDDGTIESVWYVDLRFNRWAPRRQQSNDNPWGGGPVEWCALGSRPSTHPQYRLTWYEDAGAYLSLVPVTDGVVRFVALTWDIGTQSGTLRIGTLVVADSGDPWGGGPPAWAISDRHIFEAFDIMADDVPMCVRRSGRRH